MESSLYQSQLSQSHALPGAESSKKHFSAFFKIYKTFIWSQKPKNEQEALNSIEAAWLAGFIMGGFNRDVNLEEVFTTILQTQKTENPADIVNKITTRLSIFDHFRSKFPEKQVQVNLPAPTPVQTVVASTRQFPWNVNSNSQAPESLSTSYYVQNQVLPDMDQNQLSQSMVVTSNQHNLPPLVLQPPQTPIPHQIPILPHRSYPEYPPKQQVPREDLSKPISAPEVVPQTAPLVVPQRIQAWQPLWPSVHEAPTVIIPQQPISEQEKQKARVEEEKIKKYMEYMKSLQQEQMEKIGQSQQPIEPDQAKHNPLDDAFEDVYYEVPEEQPLNPQDEKSAFDDDQNEDQPQGEPQASDQNQAMDEHLKLFKENFPKYSYSELKTIFQENQYDPIQTYQYLSRYEVN